MIVLDVNVCLFAFRTETPHHEPSHHWLTTALTGTEPVGVLDDVLASVVRISTDHRVFSTPAPPETVLAFCEAVRSAPRAVTITPGPRHWEIFARLVTHHGLRGRDVPDARLAAIALELGATFATTDRGFRRFAGLRTVDPVNP